jgi:hypothetical protein
MGFFGLVFWLAVAWLVFRACRRRGYWSAVGPRGYGRFSGWYDSSEFYAPRNPGIARERQQKSENQQGYIDALETRVTELEERLDFTERLLASRRETAQGTEGVPS